MRRAAAAHAGNVIEQEGDSWSVVFHTPMDAVAFCLQVGAVERAASWQALEISQLCSCAA